MRINGIKEDNHNKKISESFEGKRFGKIAAQMKKTNARKSEENETVRRKKKSGERTNAGHDKEISGNKKLWGSDVDEGKKDW